MLVIDKNLADELFLKVCCVNTKLIFTPEGADYTWQRRGSYFILS